MVVYTIAKLKGIYASYEEGLIDAADVVAELEEFVNGFEVCQLCGRFDVGSDEEPCTSCNAYERFSLTDKEI